MKVIVSSANSELNTALAFAYADDSQSVGSRMLVSCAASTRTAAGEALKVAMIQMAQQSQQEVKKKEAEAAQAVARGQANARRPKAITLKAKANHIFNDSLSTNLIEYQRVLAWNGVLPQTSLGGAGGVSAFVGVGR